MPDAFRSLAETLLASRSIIVDEPAVSPPEELPQLEQAEANEELVRELRLFRARVMEGVEAAIATILDDAAAEVLGRELQIAPADIQRIVERAICRYLADEPLLVRVHPTEVPLITCELPVVADERLRKGDALVELRCGSVDASLGIRFATLAQAWRTCS